MTQSTLVSTEPEAARATLYTLDPDHSIAAFKVRHLMVSHVRGELGAVTGKVWLDEQDLTRSRVEVSIDARGIDTRHAERDAHLKSGDFLDVERFPTVSFRSTKVLPSRADGGFQIVGELGIRGVTRSVKLEVDPLPRPVKDPWGNVKLGATARTSIHRKDFGLVWNVALEAGGFAVGDEVAIEIEVELIRTPESRA